MNVTGREASHGGIGGECPILELSSAMFDGRQSAQRQGFSGSPFLCLRRDLSPIPPFGSNGASLRTDIGGRSAIAGAEDVYEESDRRVRLDPYDPSTFRHAGQCEHRYTSDPALLRSS
jgi:hypothetical protein